MKSAVQPVMRAEDPGRLEFVDSLRGFALFGVFWANLLIFSGIEYSTGEQRASLFHGRLDTVAYFVERFFIENKFMIIGGATLIFKGIRAVAMKREVDA